MDDPLKSFGENAKSLSRNPLGIIALFLVLVYAMASLVIALSGSSLSLDQRWPLIWFLVVFPILVLGIFAWLVSRHHGKLYAPSDYKDEAIFKSTLEQGILAFQAVPPTLVEPVLRNVRPGAILQGEPDAFDEGPDADSDEASEEEIDEEPANGEGREEYNQAELRILGKK